ncbi:hypothetical protein FQN60_016190, partial [Etheostoma spectabile]
MGTADQLLELMFSWIEQRERCAEQLMKLARELESLREKCNFSESVGSGMSLVGAAGLFGAGVATVLTAGAAAPLLAAELLALGAGVGVAVSVVTKITEHFLSSHTLKTAQEIEQKGNEIAERIPKLFQQLKEKVVGGAVGMSFALHEFINNWKELIAKNHVTEASQSLRDTADAILQMTRILRGQFHDVKRTLKRQEEEETLKKKQVEEEKLRKKQEEEEQL